jgi:23S rRNA (cytidine1920-2'-O)/16S rRNA (cytidine1409-2'-O)-methyltransferase
MRLDQYIKNKKDITRNKAQAIIKSWNVTVWWIKVTKTWYEVNDNDIIVITELDETNYVARSAIKLKWLFESNNMNIENKIALDIWSSTGGFCQILLEKNIWKIYAVDVWTSQLHEKLRNNKKIIVKENTDIRKLEQLDDDIDVITCDVSFISLNQIIDSINSFISDNTLVILLFKPQFEVW